MFFRERLRGDHRIEGFQCGKSALDVWLVRSALHADRAGTSRTFVWIDENGDVTAYFAVTPHLVRREDTPPGLARGAPSTIPSILLAKLALVKHLHGQGLGGALLADALTTALGGVLQVGGRLIVVDAIDDEAHRFYEKHGFSPMPGSPPGRLALKASDAARSLGLEWL